MSNEFTLELCASRRNAGFTQSDIAHLLGRSPSYVSTIEDGKREPTIEEIITLSLIYGRSFEAAFTLLVDTARDNLRSRIFGLAKDVRRCADTFNRDASIEKLGRRLAEEPATHGHD